MPKSDRQATRDAMTIGAPLEPKDIVKGALHAWLAWQQDPGMPFGTAIKARILNAEGALADEFFEWLRAVFDLPMKA